MCPGVATAQREGWTSLFSCFCGDADARKHVASSSLVVACCGSAPGSGLLARRAHAMRCASPSRVREDERAGSIYFAPCCSVVGMDRHRVARRMRRPGTEVVATTPTSQIWMAYGRSGQKRRPEALLPAVCLREAYTSCAAAHRVPLRLWRAIMEHGHHHALDRPVVGLAGVERDARQ